MIKWYGTDTSKRMKWNATADTFKELYEKLVNKGIISTSDYDPYEKEVMDKAGMTEDDFFDEEGQYTFYEWLEKNPEYDLSEEEYELLIYSCNGNAYYQEVEIK